MFQKSCDTEILIKSNLHCDSLQIIQTYLFKMVQKQDWMLKWQIPFYGNTCWFKIFYPTTHDDK